MKDIVVPRSTWERRLKCMWCGTTCVAEAEDLRWDNANTQFLVICPTCEKDIDVRDDRGISYLLRTEVQKSRRVRRQRMHGSSW